jgi:hypothetical protein
MTLDIAKLIQQKDFAQVQDQLHRIGIECIATNKDLAASYVSLCTLWADYLRIKHDKDCMNISDEQFEEANRAARDIHERVSSIPPGTATVPEVLHVVTDLVVLVTTLIRALKGQ